MKGTAMSENTPTKTASGQSAAGHEAHCAEALPTKCSLLAGLFMIVFAAGGCATTSRLANEPPSPNAPISPSAEEAVEPPAGDPAGGTFGSSSNQGGAAGPASSTP